MQKAIYEIEIHSQNKQEQSLNAKLIYLYFFFGLAFFKVRAINWLYGLNLLPQIHILINCHIYFDFVNVNARHRVYLKICLWLQVLSC